MSKYTFAAVAAFMLVLLAVPVMACPPKCGPGEVWGVVTPAHYGEWHTTSYCDHHESSTCQRTQDCQQVCHTDRVRQWEAWGYRNNGQCVSDCKPDGHGNTCAKSCDSYVNVQHCEEECHYHYQHRVYYPAVYGCVATTCPAIPCPDGQDCVDGQCLQRVCPRIPCDTGFHCEENQCDPDICGEDFKCDVGFQCEENTCVAIPPEQVQSSAFFPFTNTCTDPQQTVVLNAKDGREYLARASYMGFIDNLTISGFSEAGDSDKPYYQLNPFTYSDAGIGVVALRSFGPIAKSFEYTAIKDETSTPDGWNLKVELIDLSTGKTVDTRSTIGSQMCLRTKYFFQSHY